MVAPTTKGLLEEPLSIDLAFGKGGGRGLGFRDVGFRV